MNFSLIFGLYQEKKTIYIVLVTFLVVLLLPFIVAAVITNTGIQQVSDLLAENKHNNFSVTLKNPLNGESTITLYGPFIWPTKGVITLEFGESDLPYQVFHTGIDIAGNKGDEISAFMKGKVIFADEISWGYGKHIIIDHGNNLSSLYGHLDTITVKVGDAVEQGQIIGTEGSTGWSTGPHLHFETRVYGIPVNPINFVH